jgi:hypothetical protein
LIRNAIRPKLPILLPAEAKTEEVMAQTVWLKPKQAAEIEFVERTPSGKLRHASSLNDSEYPCNQPGTRLLREWQKKSYKVTVANPGFEYDVGNIMEQILGASTTVAATWKPIVINATPRKGRFNA